MIEKISSICDRVIEYSFYLLLFLVPLILTPWNYELFEFNKMMLTFALTTVIVSTWLIKMVAEKRLIFRKTALDIPLILFLTSQLISTIYSIDRHTSLWGYYSRFNGGLLSLITYCLLYWAFVSNMDKDKTLSAIRYMLYTTMLIAAYGIAEHFGIDAKFWVQDVQNRVFSTLGQTNWLAAWLVALLLIPMAFIINSKTPKAKLLFYLLLITYYLCFLYTKSRSGFFGFGLAYVIFWGLIFLVKPALRHPLKNFLIITSSILLITFLVGSPWTPSAGQIIKKIKPQPEPKLETKVSTTPQPVPLITESGDIRRIVWKGAIEIWKHYPVFGTGVETFAYSYYWYRPREHNDISEWDFLYNKAHNEYLTILANTGTVGILAYLGLIGTFIGWIIRREVTFASKLRGQLRAKRGGKFSMNEQSVTSILIIAILSGYTSILVTNFFGFSVVPVNLLFFLFPGFVFALTQEGQSTKDIVHRERKQTLDWKQKISISFFVLCTMLFVLHLAQFWYADTRFAMAEKLDDSAWYERAYKELQTAVKLNPGEPYYHNEMAYSLAGMATVAQEAENASLSAQLAELAVAESDKALKISPYHLNFLKKRAKAMILLSSVDPKYQLKALETLLQAAELAPTDAKIFYNLGVLYSYLEQKEEAIKTLEKTVELKPNYGDAHYALASFYEEGGKIKEAKEQLKYILEKINPADSRAKNKLEELR